MALAGEMTPKEVAEKLGVSDQTVRHWIRQGELPAKRVGIGTKKRMLITDSEFDAFYQRYTRVTE